MTFPFLHFYRQKGLIVVVREVFLGKVHGSCAHHLCANVKTNHGKYVEKFFWGLSLHIQDHSKLLPLSHFAKFLFFCFISNHFIEYSLLLTHPILFVLKIASWN